MSDTHDIEQSTKENRSMTRLKKIALAFVAALYIPLTLSLEAPALAAVCTSVNALPAPPVVSGTPQVGQTLSTTNGSWTGNPTSYAYQWYTSSAAPATVFLDSLTTSNTGNQGYQFREVIPASSLSASGTVSGSIRVGFSFTSGTSGGSMTAYIGELGSGNAWSFDGTQVQLTFGGSTTLSGLNGASTVYSDYVPFTLNASKSLVIAMHYTGTTINVGQLTGTPINVYYSNTVTDPSATSPAGLSTSSGTVLAAGEVEFRTASGGSAISGATFPTYTPVTGDVGNQLAAGVIASNLGGASCTSLSTFTAPVSSTSTISNVSPPVITGTAQVGQTLMASTGVWTNNPGTTTYAYQWNRGGTAITGATASTYVPVTADVGNTLTVTVIATNNGVASSPSTSAATLTVIAASTGVPVLTAAPVISGTPQAGATLSASTGSWTNCGSCTYTYSWASSVPTPDVTNFVATNGSNINVGPWQWGTQNASQPWSITNPDTQTLVFQVRSGDHWPPDASNNPPEPERSEISNNTIWSYGTEINVSYNFMITGADTTGSGTGTLGMTIGQFHNDDAGCSVALSGPCMTSPTLEIDLQPGDYMSTFIGYLTASAQPSNSTFYGNYTIFNNTGGTAISYAQIYADTNKIVRGHNYSMKIDAKLTGPGDTSGFVKVWRDGVLVANTSGQIGFGYGTYFKYGEYRYPITLTETAQYQNMMVAARPLVLGTGSTYVPVAGDVGNAVSVTVVATNSTGSSAPVTVPITTAIAPAGSTGSPKSVRPLPHQLELGLIILQALLTNGRVRLRRRTLWALLRLTTRYSLSDLGPIIS
jgi:hypothetical protein